MGSRGSPSSLHKLMTALNVLTEKSTRQSRQRISGNCTLRVLCIGVKCSCASAATPYWSRVLRVLVSQWFRAGHQRAWSDQSIAISATTKTRSFVKTPRFLIERKIIFWQINESRCSCWSLRTIYLSTWSRKLVRLLVSRCRILSWRQKRENALI